MTTYIKDNFAKEKSKGEENFITVMVIFMKVNLMMENVMEKEGLFILTEMFMKEIGLMAMLKEKVLMLLKKMTTYMKVSERIMFKKAKEKKSIMIRVLTLVHFLMVQKMVKENLNGKMAHII